MAGTNRAKRCSRRVSRRSDASPPLGDGWRRWLFWAVVVTVALFSFHRLGDALAPLLAALLIAMALEPPVRRLVDRGMGRTAAAATVTVAVFGLLLLAIGILQSGTWWQPSLVVALFAAMEVIESSVLSPKLVGGQVGGRYRRSRLYREA